MRIHERKAIVWPDMWPCKALRHIRRTIYQDGNDLVVKISNKIFKVYQIDELNGYVTCGYLREA